MRQGTPGQHGMAALALALLLAACAPAAAHRVLPTPSPARPAATATPSPTSDPTKVCALGACLAYEDWAAGVAARIDPRAVGYAFAILSRGQIVRQQVAGQARTAV